MKFGNILLGFFALLFFGVQLYNVYDGIVRHDPKMTVSALYLLTIGLFMVFNLYNALLTQSGKPITAPMIKMQLCYAVALFLIGFAILIAVFIYDLSVVTKIVTFILLVSLFFEIRTRIYQLNTKK